jgi:hypothetical protein
VYSRRNPGVASVRSVVETQDITSIKRKSKQGKQARVRTARTAILIVMVQGWQRRAEIAVARRVESKQRKQKKHDRANVKGMVSNLMLQMDKVYRRVDNTACDSGNTSGTLHVWTEDVPSSWLSLGGATSYGTIGMTPVELEWPNVVQPPLAMLLLLLPLLLRLQLQLPLGAVARNLSLPAAEERCSTEED